MFKQCDKDEDGRLYPGDLETFFHYLSKSQLHGFDEEVLDENTRATQRVLDL